MTHLLAIFYTNIREQTLVNIPMNILLLKKIKMEIHYEQP